MLSVRFDVGVSLLLAPARADKRGPKAPIPLVENAGIMPAIRKRVARALSRVLLKALGNYQPLVYTKTVDSVEGALIGSSNSEYPVLFISEQLKRKCRKMASRFAAVTSEEIIQIKFLWCILSHCFSIY